MNMKRVIGSVKIDSLQMRTAFHGMPKLQGWDARLTVARPGVLKDD